MMVRPGHDFSGSDSDICSGNSDGNGRGGHIHRFGGDNDTMARVSAMIIGLVVVMLMRLKLALVVMVGKQ